MNYTLADAMPKTLIIRTRKYRGERFRKILSKVGRVIPNYLKDKATCKLFTAINGNCESHTKELEEVYINATRSEVDWDIFINTVVGHRGRHI